MSRTWVEAGVGLAALATAGSAFAEGTASVPVTMTEAIRRALAQNPTFVVARDEITRAQALLEQVRSQSIPTVTGTASYLQLSASQVFDGIVTQPASQENLSGIVRIPLVNPRAWAQWSHAGDNIDVATAAAFDTRRIIAVATGHAYLSVLEQKRVLEANQRALDTAKAHLDDAHARFVAGAGNRLDEVRAGEQLAADETLVESSRAAVVRATEALGVLAGQDTPLDSTDEPRFAVLPPLDHAVDLATQERSDVVAARQRGKAAHDIRRDNWTELSPSVAGTFTAFYQNPPTSLLPATGWQAELLLTVPFYDGGLACGLGKERRTLESEATTQTEATVRQARSDVRAAYDTVARARAALPRALEASRLGKEALELTIQAYEAGASTNIEVIDAEQTARDAEIQAEVAADTERQATLDALAAVGQFP